MDNEIGLVSHAVFKYNKLLNLKYDSANINTWVDQIHLKCIYFQTHFEMLYTTYIVITEI